MIRTLATALALACCVALPAFADGPIVIKFSHVVAADTPKGQMAERFKQLVEERSKGRLKVEVYPNSTLYKDKEEIEALQLGSVQMLAPSLAKFGPIGVKEFEVFDLPYIFSDEAAFHKVADGPVGRSLLDKLTPKGIQGFGYLDNGFHVWATNKAIHKPEDMHGLKMRIQSSKVLDAQMRALGANPQVMAAADVYQALQTGVVDGTEAVPSGLYTQRIYEVCKFTTVSNHGHLAYAVIGNKKFFDGLPADLRAVVDSSMTESIAYGNQIAAKENADDLEKIRVSGKSQVYVLTPQEKEVFRQTLIPVHKEVEGRIGHDVIQQVYQATGFVAPK